MIWPLRKAVEFSRISSNFLRKLLIQRHLIWNFVVRDLRARYVGSFMGFFWSVVHPLVLLASYTFVFSVIFKARLPEAMPGNFALFLFCGILPWLYFQDTVMRSTQSVVDAAGLIRKTVFPSEILPVIVVVSNLVTHLIGFAILFLVLLWVGTVSWPVLALPLIVFLLAIFTLGLGWFFAALQVFVRDTAQILSVVMILWFWFTPIFYQIGFVPPAFQPWMQLNPMAEVVEGYRRILLLGQFPEPLSLARLAIAALGAFFIGGLVFRSTKREFVDVL